MITFCIEKLNCRVVLTSIFIVQSIVSSLCLGQNFYPLQVGNLWQYKVVFQGDFSGYFTQEIIRDTLMPNGNRYFVFSNGDADRMTDSSVSYRYDSRNFDSDTSTTELALNMFNNSVGSSWQSFEMAVPNGVIAKMEGSFLTNWFGEVVEMKFISYHTQSGLFGADNYYSKKHGLVYSALEGGASYELTGARIGGILYGVITEVVSSDDKAPEGFGVANPYPNPFNPSTTIAYSLPATGRVSLKIFNLLGQEVVVLVSGEQGVGAHQVVWNASQRSSGIYLVRLETVNNTAVRKLLLLK